MKKILLALLFALTAVAFVAAESGKVSYLEGDVKIKAKSGQTQKADIGSAVVTGDTVITGRDGFCEITLDNGSTIKVNSGTVFAITEREDAQAKGKKRSVFSTIIGVVTCKFQKFTGNEPYIATPTTACGVRGTEFTIVAGADGSALYVVDSGAVAVSSQGQEVILAPEEAVKVLAGQKPGRKFEVKRGTMDFSKISAESEASMLANPNGTMDALFTQMKDYEIQATDWKKKQYENIELVKKLREDAAPLRETMTKDEWNTYYNENITPREGDTTYLSLNSRYYSVGCLNMRRYLVSTIYVAMRTRHIVNTENSDWLAFKGRYDSFLKFFDEKFIKPGYIIEGDI